jgi:hypothetical protein
MPCRSRRGTAATGKLNIRAMASGDPACCRRSHSPSLTPQEITALSSMVRNERETGRKTWRLCTHKDGRHSRSSVEEFEHGRATFPKGAGGSYFNPDGSCGDPVAADQKVGRRRQARCTKVANSTPGFLTVKVTVYSRGRHSYLYKYQTRRWSGNDGVGVTDTEVGGEHPRRLSARTRIRATCTAMPISKLLSFMTAPEI